MGVLLYSPKHKFAKAVFSNNYSRVQTVFKGLELKTDHLRAMRHWMESRIEIERKTWKSVHDLSDFAGKRLNEIRITPPRSIMVSDPAKDLGDLFGELVQVRKPNKKQLENPFPAVHEFFNSPEIRRYVEPDLQVVVPRWEKKLTVPYTLTNGRIYSVFPQWFSSVERAVSLAVVGRLINGLMDTSKKAKTKEFHILPRVSPSANDPRLKEKLASVLSEFKDDGVKVIWDDGIPEYLETMKAKICT